MALLFLFSLVALYHCGAGALQVNSTTNASSSYRVVVPAKVHAVQDAEGLLRQPSSVAEPDPDRSLVVPVAEPDPDRSPLESIAEPDPDRSPVEPVAEPDPDRSPVEPVAEPDPDRSQPDSDELATKKPCSEGQQGYEMVKEQIDGEDKAEAEGKEKANRKKEGKKKTKKHHGGGDKGKKEKAKKQRRQSDEEEEEEEEEENTKKRIHRHHGVEGESGKKKNKLSHHIINNNDGGDDSDDEAEEEEKMAKRWRKAIKKRFGHGRRSQREGEEADMEKVNH